MARVSDAFNAHCTVARNRVEMAARFFALVARSGSFNDLKRCYNRSDAMLSGSNRAVETYPRDKSMPLIQINASPFRFLISVNAQFVSSEFVVSRSLAEFIEETEDETNFYLITRHCFTME